MNTKNGKMILITSILVLVVIIVIIATGKSKKGEEANNDLTAPITEGTATGNSSPTQKTTNPKPTPPLPSNSIKLTNPTEGQQYSSGVTAGIAWEISPELENANVTVSLMKGGKEITVITEKPIKANDKKFLWQVPDLSVYGTTGYSIKITTIGLAKNISSQTGEFTIIK